MNTFIAHLVVAGTLTATTGLAAASPLSLNIENLFRYGLNANSQLVNPSPRANFAMQVDIPTAEATFVKSSQVFTGTVGSFTGQFTEVGVGGSGAFSSNVLDGSYTAESLSFLGPVGVTLTSSAGNWSIYKFIDVETANPTNVLRAGYGLNLNAQYSFVDSATSGRQYSGRVLQQIQLNSFSGPSLAFANSLLDFDDLTPASLASLIADIGSVANSQGSYIEETSQFFVGVFDIDNFRSLRGTFSIVSEASQVPEPSLMSLFVAACLGLFAAKLRRRRFASHLGFFKT